MRIKYIFFWIMFGIFLLTGCTVRQQKPVAEDTKGLYKIDISLSLLSNDSVGNEWEKRILCNGNEIGGEKQIIIKPKSTVLIKAIVIEKDCIPDVGQGEVCLVLEENISVSEIVTVKENRGRYAGNIAEWELLCVATLIE